MRTRHAVLILLTLYAAMTAVTWQGWANPVIDGGREMNTPWRLLGGEKLYSEVYYLYGPVAPFVNAFLFKIFGVQLRTLYAAGLAGGLVLTLVILSLGHKFMSPLESLLAAVAVLLLCVFKQRGNMIFPYSYSALYGTVLGTLALAAQVNHVRFNRRGSLFMSGMLSGLTFCCKPEFGFAAAASLLAVVMISPREQRLKNAGIALISVLIFPLVLYGLLLARIPAGAIFKDTFLIPGQIPAELLYFNRLKLGLNHPAKTLRELISAVAVLCGTGGVIALAGVRATGNSILSAPRGQGPRRIWWITGASWGFLFLHVLFFGTQWDLNPFRALPVLSLAMIVYYFHAGQDTGDGIHRRQLLIVAVYSLTVLARVIVRVPAGGAYGAGLVPVPLLLFIYLARADLPIFRVTESATRWRQRAVLVLLSTAFAATMGVFAYRQMTTPQSVLSTGRGDIRMAPSLTMAMSQALDFISKNTRPGEYILALPEGSSLNFLGDRPVPVRYEIVTPGFLSNDGEQRAIRQIQEKKVPYIFLFNRPTSEFGPEVFGRDYCRTMMAWIQSHYEPAAVFGEGVSADVQIGDRPFFIKCYRERGRGQSAADRIR